jgi:hypothetical protein
MASLDGAVYIVKKSGFSRNLSKLDLAGGEESLGSITCADCPAAGSSRVPGLFHPTNLIPLPDGIDSELTALKVLRNGGDVAIFSVWKKPSLFSFSASAVVTRTEVNPLPSGFVDSNTRYAH